MTLLKPLGLIALIAIIILILIYIIKPSFQQKFISTTFVWKLALNYKKKKLPINKLRNIILIICQVTILVLCASILAKPAKPIKVLVEEYENVLIIDSSASMLTTDHTQTRFVRAIDYAKEMAETTFDKGGLCTIIVASKTPYYLVNRASKAQRDNVENLLNEMATNSSACYYGEGNIQGALDITESILLDNPKAEITVFTDTEYSYIPDDIKVVDVKGNNDWNAAILGVRSEMEDGYYTFFIDIACYGYNQMIDVRMRVLNATTKSSESGGLYIEDEFVPSVEFTATVECSNDEVKTLVFKHYDSSDDGQDETTYEHLESYQVEKTEDISKWIVSYETVNVYIEGVNDGIEIDNHYSLYNGRKQKLRVQYVSSVPEIFMSTTLATLKNSLENTWDLDIVSKVSEGETSGFDLYIYEDNYAADFTVVPEDLPDDGVILILNPTKSSDSARYKIGDVKSTSGEACIEESTSTLTNYINASSVVVTQYQEIRSEDYNVIWKFSDNSPALLLKDDQDSKIVIFTFSVHYSNLAVDFSLLPKFMYNIFDYFFPPMVSSHAVTVGEEIVIRSRGENVTISSGHSEEEVIEKSELPKTKCLDIPETYTAKCYAMSGDANTELIYVSIPTNESNIFYQAEKLTSPYREQVESDYYDDLLVIFASILVAFIFVEWILHVKEGM